jgi:hypothetical protein
MAKSPGKPKVLLPDPKFDEIDDGFICRWDGNEVVIEVHDPEYDALRRLMAEIVARINDTIIHQSRINLLSQYQCGDFHNVCFSRDGHVPWIDHLITLIDPLKRRLQQRSSAKPEGQARSPRGLKAADLLKKTFEDPKAIVPNVILEGVQILAGKPKLGKSRLMLHIAVAVAVGGKALEKIPVEAGEVLYLSLEDPERRLQKRILGALLQDQCPDTLEYEAAWPRLDQGGLADLEDWIERHPRARLIVIDTLKRIKSKTNSSGNAYDIDYESIQALQDLVNRHPGLAIVVIHHTNKLRDVEDFMDAISGSTGLPGAVDGFAVLRRQRGSADAVLEIAHRDLDEDQKHALKSDPLTGGWEFLGDADQYQLSQSQQEIMKVLPKNGDPMTPKAIAFALGKPDKKSIDTLYVQLTRMLSKGVLMSPIKGYYSVKIVKDV